MVSEQAGDERLWVTSLTAELQGALPSGPARGRSLATECCSSRASLAANRASSAVSCPVMEVRASSSSRMTSSRRC